MAGLTVKQTPLKKAGGYTTTTPTLSPGAGHLKPFGGGVPDRRPASHAVASPYHRGRKGRNKDTEALLKNVPRTVVTDAAPPPPEEEE
jgi:hypothetical protein